MDNRDLVLKKEIINLESKKNKYYLVGFILGITPYLFILLISSYMHVTASFKEILIIMGILTALINAHVVSNHIYKKLIEFFNLKYDLDYYKIKETI